MDFILTKPEDLIQAREIEEGKLIGAAIERMEAEKQRQEIAEGKLIGAEIERIEAERAKQGK